MNIQQVCGIFFSPTGHTREVVQHMAESLGEKIQLHDATSFTMGTLHRTFSAEDLVVVGAPVYGGRIPVLARERLREIKGAGTPAVVVVTYGNRAYEDALLELKTVLEEANFCVIAAAAVVTEHSIVHTVGRFRPEENDWKEIDTFLAQVKQQLSNTIRPLCSVPGNRPYRTYKGIPLKPKVNKDCTACGFCARECPANAIPEQKPQTTDWKRCISCMRCVTYCPQEARYLSKWKYWIVAQKLERHCAQRRENAFFYDPHSAQTDEIKL